MFSQKNITDVLIASQNKFCVVAQATCFSVAYLAPWKVEEYNSKEKAIEIADIQNKAFRLAEYDFPLPPNYKPRHVYYIYDDTGKLLRSPVDVYPNFVPLGI